MSHLFPGKPTIDPSAHRLLRISHSRRPALLMHTIKMMDRPGAASHGMGLADGRGDVGFGKKHCFRQTSSQRQMTDNRSGEGAPGTVGGVGSQPDGLENFLLQAALAG